MSPRRSGAERLTGCFQAYVAGLTLLVLAIFTALAVWGLTVLVLAMAR